MNFVEPFAKNNAIKMVAFVLQFKSEISESVIEEIINHYDSTEFLKNLLPRKMKQEAVTVEITNGKQQQVSSSKLGGIKFDKVLPNGVSEWALNINKTSIIVNCAEYTRWEEIWKKVLSFIKDLENILKDIQIQAAVLEYHDDFIIKDEKNKWKEELFNKQSKYLNSNLFEEKDYWHLHHGFFINQTEPFNSKILNNLNIDYGIEDDKDKKIFLRTQHRSIFENSMKLEEFMSSNIITEKFTFLHDINKNIFKNILTNDALKEIGLEN